LLGSWIHRTALGHGVNGSAFLQTDPGDVDWSIDDELLRWLSRGSGISISALRSMTIPLRAPEAARTDFAMAAGSVFPGCHAFCPRCGVQDRLVHGEVILAQANAGRWRMSCEIHGLLLDGADDEDELTPASSRRWRRLLNGRLPTGRELEAPAFVLAFERATRGAERGRSPSDLWCVTTPGAFLKIARLVSSFALLRQNYGSYDGSAAGAVLGGRLSYRIGSNSFDPDIIDRAPTRSRVRALIATALLMLSPKGAAALRLSEWPMIKDQITWRRPSITAWQAALTPWHWATLDMIVSHVSDWPSELRRSVQEMTAERIISMP